MYASLLSNSIWSLWKSSFFNYEDRIKIENSTMCYTQAEWRLFPEVLRYMLSCSELSSHCGDCFQRNLVVPSSGKRRIFSWSNHNSFQSLPQERRRIVDRSGPHHLTRQTANIPDFLQHTVGEEGKEGCLKEGRWASDSGIYRSPMWD